MRARSERVLNGPPARSYSETDSSNGPDPWLAVLVGYRTLLFGLRRSAGNSSSNYGEVLTVRLAWWRSPSLMGARGDIAPLMTRLCELLRWYGTLATITSRHLEVDAKSATGGALWPDQARTSRGDRPTLRIIGQGLRTRSGPTRVRRSRPNGHLDEVSEVAVG
jgi:hypothetical protein